MTDPHLFPTRAELMERIETAWAELSGAIADLDQHQLSIAPVREVAGRSTIIWRISRFGSRWPRPSWPARAVPRLWASN